MKVAGVTPHPDNRWMMQIAGNLTDPEDGFLRDKRKEALRCPQMPADSYGAKALENEAFFCFF